MNRIRLKTVSWPKIDMPEFRPECPDTCYTRRVYALREAMRRENLDCVVIYADREHYANFKYYLGFEPRFEEGLAVIHQREDAGDYVLLGNECYAMYRYAKIPVRPILCQSLSLPNQPMDQFVSIRKALQDAGIREHFKVGLVGWKLFTPSYGSDPSHMFCVCSYIVDGLRDIIGYANLTNATGMLINPKDGLRLLHDVHEIAYMEYGAALASECVKNAWRSIAPGKREMEIAAQFQSYGQQLTCHTMFASGENTNKGLISPGFRKVELGDPITFSMGLEGGLSCRGAYAAHNADEMDASVRGFEMDVARPYYEAVVAWYEMIGLNVCGGDVYNAVDSLFPKKEYGWTLNPGHLISTEEWFSSGIAPNSTVPFKSGMIVQMDIIPSVAPYVSPNAEDGVCIADEALRQEIQALYPDMWARFRSRREYMERELGIRLKKEILPMSNLAGRYSPYLLNLELAFAAE